MGWAEAQQPVQSDAVIARHIDRIHQLEEAIREAIGDLHLTGNLNDREEIADNLSRALTHGIAV